VLPWQRGGPSARTLARALTAEGCPALSLRRGENSRYRYRENDLVINYGSGTDPGFPTINRPAAVKVASSKIGCFRALADAGVWTVDFTTSIDLAWEWHKEGKIVYARARDRGREGQGINVVAPNTPIDDWPFAKLYTRGAEGREYRVHVVGNEAIRTQKRYREGGDATSSPIRSHANGYRFILNGVAMPAGLEDLAVRTVRALGLDFGAVDIINDRSSADEEAGLPPRLKVLEVNTAPGLVHSQTTAQVYARALLDHFILDERNVA